MNGTLLFILILVGSAIMIAGVINEIKSQTKRPTQKNPQENFNQLRRQILFNKQPRKTVVDEDTRQKNLSRVEKAILIAKRQK